MSWWKVEPLDIDMSKYGTPEMRRLEEASLSDQIASLSTIFTESVLSLEEFSKTLNLFAEGVREQQCKR